MSDLHFVVREVRNGSPGRVIHTASDRFGHLYTIGINTDGSNGFAAVYDQDSLETLYSRTCFDHRIHADELKAHLQEFATLIGSLHAAYGQMSPSTH